MCTCVASSVNVATAVTVASSRPCHAQASFQQRPGSQGWSLSLGPSSWMAAPSSACCRAPHLPKARDSRVPPAQWNLQLLATVVKTLSRTTGMPSLLPEAQATLPSDSAQFDILGPLKKNAQEVFQENSMSESVARQNCVPDGH